MFYTDKHLPLPYYWDRNYNISEKKKLLCLPPMEINPGHTPLVCVFALTSLQKQLKRKEAPAINRKKIYGESKCHNVISSSYLTLIF